MDNKNTDYKDGGTIDKQEVRVDDKIVQVILDDSPVVSLDDFQTNDKKVLSLLNHDGDAIDSQYTFNGLVRKLGIHQQSLARSLHRLETAGLIKRTNSGYKLTENLNSMLVKKSRIDLENLSKRISRQYSNFEQIIQLYIPSNINVEDIINRLTGKWFGSLRWIGLFEDNSGYVLQWASDDKYQVNLKIISRYAVVESNAMGLKNKSDAMINAYRILEQVTKLLKESDKGTTGKNRFSSFGAYN